MKDEKGSHVLVLLDGEEPSKQLLEHCMRHSVALIATDGAANYAMNHHIPLHSIVGDMDSIAEEIRTVYEAKGTRIVEDPDQYSNDFEKALEYILSEQFSPHAMILGIHGKRTDHLLTNFSVMLRYTDRFDRVVAYDATHRHHFLTAERNKYSFTAAKGIRISLTPLPEAEGVKTEGLFYPIVNERMIFGSHEGLSNIISAGSASVEITSGALLISVPHSIQ